MSTAEPSKSVTRSSAQGETGETGGLTYGTDAFSTIQDAIDETNPGGTVNVAAGTYVEDLVIDEANLNLAGADDNAPSETIIQGLAMTDSTSWPVVAPNIDVIANGARIHGFTLRGPDPRPWTTIPAGW